LSLLLLKREDKNLLQNLSVEDEENNKLKREVENLNHLFKERRAALRANLRADLRADLRRKRR